MLRVWVRVSILFFDNSQNLDLIKTSEQKCINFQHNREPIEEEEPNHDNVAKDANTLKSGKQ